MRSFKVWLATTMRRYADFMAPVTSGTVESTTEERLLVQLVHYKGRDGRLEVTDDEIMRAGLLPRKVDHLRWWRDESKMRFILEIDRSKA